MSDIYNIFGPFSHNKLIEMFRKPFGMSLAVLALTGRVSAIQLNRDRLADEDLENDNGDDYME